MLVLNVKYIHAKQIMCICIEYCMTSWGRGEVDREMDNLFENAMKGEWKTVIEVYEKSPAIQVAKLTVTEGTALHIAVADGQTDVVSTLVKIIGKRKADAPTILGSKNTSGDTPLHLAAALGNAEMCQCMALKAPELIKDRNSEGETPLFLAACYGKKKAFLCLYSIHKGKENADYQTCRRSNGDTILHAAISGEYFSLAYQIIQRYPDLVNSINENGKSPLHILASKPDAFKSSSHLRLFDGIIYHCIIVNDLEKEKEPLINSQGKERSSGYPENYETCMNFVQLCLTFFKAITKGKNVNGDRAEEENFKACITFFKPIDGEFGNRADEENPQQKTTHTAERKAAGTSNAMESESNDDSGTKKLEKNYKDGSFPPNYATLIRFFMLTMKALLVILGVGFWRITKIKEKKERHRWATQVMNELVQRASSYKYNNTGMKPQNSEQTEDKETAVPTSLPHAQSADSKSASLENTQDQRDKVEREKKDEPVLVAAKMGVTEMVNKFLDIHPDAIQELNTSKKNLVLLTYDKKEAPAPDIGKKQTPILIAAKMGVTEMVEKILDTFPVALQDLDADKKNVLLLAVENRQTYVFKLLMKRPILHEAVFRQLDNQGNSALHLAATFGDFQPWLIAGAALQMQWEIKWYKFVKSSVPPNFFPHYNTKGQTPKEIFTQTHKNLIKNGSEWLTKTSESCSVVAALIATVAFATSATVPGGLNQNNGAPTLENHPAFNVFAISSLVALCFSVTALVNFLTILTSRYQEKDFAKDLPRKLLLGLTSLFTSIASMLVSFCAGHFFVLKDNVRNAAYPIYAATCLPVTLFAFAQLPLYFDLTWAIFKKVPEPSYRH